MAALRPVMKKPEDYASAGGLDEQPVEVKFFRQAMNLHNLAGDDATAGLQCCQDALAALRAEG